MFSPSKSTPRRRGNQRAESPTRVLFTPDRKPFSPSKPGGGGSTGKRAGSFLSSEKENCLSPAHKGGSGRRQRGRSSSNAAQGAFSPTVLQSDDTLHRGSQHHVDVGAELSTINIEIDMMLDRVASGVTRLEENAQAMKFEVGTVQAIELDKLEEKVDTTETHVCEVKSKTAATVRAVEKDKVAMYAVCCVLLTGVVIGILAVLHVFGGDSGDQNSNGTEEVTR